MKKNIKINMTEESIKKVEKHYEFLKEKGLVKTKSDCLKLMVDIAHLITEKDSKLILKNYKELRF